MSGKGKINFTNRDIEMERLIVDFLWKLNVSVENGVKYMEQLILAVLLWTLLLVNETGIVETLKSLKFETDRN